MSQNPVLFIDEVPAYECREGRMYVRMGDQTIAMPAHVFLAGCAAGKAAIVVWQKSERAKNARVIPIREMHGH